MTRLSFKPKAKADLQEIGDYIAQDNLEAANSFVGRLIRRCTDLTRFPNTGRKREDIETGYRSATEGDYVIFYRLQDKDTVVILRIVHGKRDLRKIIID